MKTEREFLEGIYRKAEERQETTERTWVSKNPPVYKRAGMAVAAAVVVLILPFGAFGIWNRQAPEKQNKTMPQQEVDPVAYRMYMPSTHIFEGTITEVTHAEGSLAITVEPVKEFRGEGLGEVTLQYWSEEEEIMQALAVGETALFFVIEENGSYQINETENGICRYLDTEDGYRVYENQYGEKVSTKALLEE